MDPAALVMALIGLALILWAHRITAFFARGLEWQKRQIGGWTVDWQMRAVRSRAALWLIRTFGALIVLGALISLLVPARS